MSNFSKEVLEFFPKKISNLISDKIAEAEEIRIRQAQNIIIKTNTNKIEINYLISANDILEIMQKICEYSIYSYQNQISEGYITVKGGHRIGITGTCVIQDGKIINIKYINSLNFRIARQIIRSSESYTSRNLKWRYNMEFNYSFTSWFWKDYNIKRCNKKFEFKFI